MGLFKIFELKINEVQKSEILFWHNIKNKEQKMKRFGDIIYDN